MTDDGKYNASGLNEAQFEPGSNHSVLRNKLGITSAHDMDKAEVAALVRVTDALLHEYDAEHRFTAKDICHMHKAWLGGVYQWAGKYRNVNISKDGFSFAVATQVPALMAKFETEQLARYTPCNFANRVDVVRGLAEVHAELVLIHPFREGNGRCSRILIILMALQAGLPILDFSLISGSKKLDYFVAVQVAMDRDYEPMERLFSEIVQNSINAWSG